MTEHGGARQEGTQRPVDRWAGSDGEYDRRADGDRPYELWAQNDHRPDTDRHYDLWAAADPEYDRWAAADSEYDHLAETGGEYDGRNRLAGIARSPKVKWIGLLVAWIIVTGVLLAVHLIILIWVIMVGLIGYVVYAVVRETPRGARPQRRHATTAAEIADDDRERFNTPPGWPEPPPDWTPPPGWQPNPAWPPAPPGWQFWLPPARRGDNERAARASHHRREPDDYRFTDDWR
jgi:hypothetical protein